MRLICLKRSIAPRAWLQARSFSSPAVQEDDEYTASPQYPPILDLSYKKKLDRSFEKNRTEIRNVKTVEEKQLKLNMPRYYGFKTFMFHEDHIPYNCLPIAQHITKTHLIQDKELPAYYQNVSAENLETIAKDIEEAVLMEVEGIRKSYELREENLEDHDKANLHASAIVKSLSRILNNSLAHQYPHIADSQVDIEPRLEAAWRVGGMVPPNEVKRVRAGHHFFKQFENDPIDRVIGYMGAPILTLRSQLPLPCIISASEAENPALEVPFFKYDPRVIGIPVEYRHAANIPGFWPGDSHTFGLISFLKTGHLKKRSVVYPGEENVTEALNVQGVLASYGWLHSQANYLGFTTLNDLTYPLVTQTVLTNGQDFKFFTYQLNTLLMHGNHTTENPKRNVCWTTDNVKLYAEINDGKIVGLNEDVLKMLLQFYGNAPAERLGINMRPYLSQEEKIIADYEDDDKRQWLEREYKYIMTNRPRLQPIDEIYAWEKIYKIDHKTRPMDKRLRFFELFKKPWTKRLDERPARYIPKACRPDLPKYKGRMAKEYWP
ncbi:hypothetical protein HUJ04_006196 [Dendroctonus ponderosae]|uniref:28S ribosomal protein S30, mitochondrial n=1 Tax=Dendroctonus ponderosae TaxID=77166 RepID=J3JVY3_DENPD